MSAGSVDERAVDALIEGAVEILLERVLATVVPPKNPTSWRERVRGTLHLKHDRRAFELLADEDVDDVTAKALADWLDPPKSTPPPPRPLHGPLCAPQTDLDGTISFDRLRRSQRLLGASDAHLNGWLDHETQTRCIAGARAALAEGLANAKAMNAAAAAKKETK